MSSDIVLITPPNRRNDSLGKYYPPFALMFLSSFLETNNIKTKIIDIKEEQQLSTNKTKFMDAFLANIIDVIKKDSPLLVGIPAYTVEYQSVMDLITNIKEKVDTKIVVGGVHATLKPEDFLFEGSPVDFAICGDGETPLLKLFKSLSNNDETYKNVEGVAFYHSRAKQLITNGSYVEEDLSKYPMPDYSKLDMNFYTRPTTTHIRFLLLSGIQIFTSRGCPYNCEFCAVGFLRKKNKKAAQMRYRSIDQVIEELALLRKNYKIDCFYVLDDCFMTKKERTIEFCEKLIKKDLGMIWGAETRANFLKEKDEDVLRLMKKAGLVQLDFGIESGSPAMLKKINKQLSIDQIRTAVKLCKKNGIRTYANIMYNLPNETEEDVRLTNQLLEELKPTVVGAATAVPLFGTAMYEKYFFPKLSPSEYEIYNEGVYETIVDERFKLSKHDVNVSEIVQKINNKYYYNPFAGIDFKWFYWKTVFKSDHLSAYLKAFLCGFSASFIKPILRYPINKLKRLLG